MCRMTEKILLGIAAFVCCLKLSLWYYDRYSNERDEEEARIICMVVDSMRQMSVGDDRLANICYSLDSYDTLRRYGYMEDFNHRFLRPRGIK